MLVIDLPERTMATAVWPDTSVGMGGLSNTSRNRGVTDTPEMLLDVMDKI